MTALVAGCGFAFAAITAPVKGQQSPLQLPFAFFEPPPKPAPKPPAARSAKALPKGAPSPAPPNAKAATAIPAPQPKAQLTVPKRPVRATPPATAPTPAEQRQQILSTVRSWGYQLRQIRFPDLAAAPHDLVVIDHALSAGRRFVHEFSPEQLRLAKSKPDGTRRLVLAYLSIGEAERYRFYWSQDWFEADKKPGWLGAMNTVWDGNYLVQFWDAEWQRLIYGSPESYLERIKAAGFDGVYIDRADVYAEWAKTNPQAQKAMESFIVGLASAARATDPYFLVVLQNAEELVASKPVLDAIDAIAKEDLYYGIDHDASPNAVADVDWSLEQLRLARKARKKVLVVEYLSEADKAATARQRAEAEGFLLHVTRRDLGQLILHGPDQAASGEAMQAQPSAAPSR